MTEKIRIARWRLNVPVEVEAVYDAAMALNNCCDEIGLIMDDMLSKPAPKLSIENYKAVTGCLFDLREACRRAKEGR